MFSSGCSNSSPAPSNTPTVAVDATRFEREEEAQVDRFMEWSMLPSDLWSSIASKLDIVSADRVRLRAVSKDFRTFLPFHHQPICLLLPQEEQELDEAETMRLLLDEHHQPKPKIPPPPRRLIPLGEQQIHHLNLPEAHEKRCVCSAGNWLVTVDEDHNIRLLNPFTRREIHLPSQRNFIHRCGIHTFGSDIPLIVMNGFLRKVVFSSLDFTLDCWIAMAIYSSGNRLAIYKPGDASWTLLDFGFFNCDDAIYFRHQFFIVDALGAVSTYDIKTGNLDPFSPRLTRSLPVESSARWYLVEWMGELLMVKRIWPEYPSPKTTKFSLLKRDFEKNIWIEFNNLGEYSLFLGLNTSTSVLTSDYTSGSIEKNCIYFSANRFHPDDYAEIGLPMATDDIGVYSLEDESIRYIYDGISRPSCSPPIWIIPTLGQNQ